MLDLLSATDYCYTPRGSFPRNQEVKKVTPPYGMTVARKSAK